MKLSDLSNDAFQFAFSRGQADFKAGRERPSVTTRFRRDGTPRTLAEVRWYGWMLERAKTLMEQQRVREMMTGEG